MGLGLVGVTRCRESALLLTAGVPVETLVQLAFGLHALRRLTTPVSMGRIRVLSQHDYYSYLGSGS